jgi:putative lipoprotein
LLASAALAVLGGCNGAGDNGGAAAQAPSVLTGTVLYRERIALPADAQIEVRLEDVTRADAPADVLAEQTTPANGRQVPIPFELRYPPSRIEPNHRYGVRASIRAPGGEVMFTTTTHRAVLSGGAAHQNVEILVQRAGGAAPEPAPGGPAAGGGGAGNAGGAAGAAGDRAAAASLTGGTWWLVAIQRPGAAEEPIAGRYSIAFADGRLSGLGGCNRYTGGYQEPEPGKLKVSPMATTLMACPEPSIADEFLRAVGGATRYELDGERLLLTYGDGGVLTFTRDAPAAALARPIDPLAAAPAAQAREAGAAAAPEVGRTFVFDCDGDLSFAVRTGPGEMALWAPKSLGGRYQVLSLTRSASGARYAEGDTVFWSKGELATIEYAGQRYVDCRSNPRKVPWADAARRGASFRALGNEPSWSLEIFRDRLAMITELGARRTELPYTVSSVGASTTYRASGDGRELVAVVDRTACVDTMSGETFEYAAAVTFDGAMLHGCGRFL